METIETLTNQIAAAPTADLYYRRGRLYWKLGDKARAITDYSSATELDPASPATEALRLCRDIMDFYHTDLYNP